MAYNKAFSVGNFAPLRSAKSRWNAALERMDMEIKIREAVLSDAEEIQNCVQEAYQHYIERIGKPPGPMLDDYAEVIKSHLVYVAESDGVVGVLVLMKSENRFLLDNVAVDPSQQGKGIGMKLIKLAESDACRLGYKKIELYSHESMHENI